MIACYLGLYEEGEVEHINGVRPCFLGLQLGGRLIEQNTKHMPLYHVQRILIITSYLPNTDIYTWQPQIAKLFT